MMKHFRTPKANELGWLLAGAAIVGLVWGGLTWQRHSKLALKPETTSITSQWIPETVKHWEPQIDALAKKYQIDPNLIAIIMTLESGGDPSAKSSAGANGLMQITSPTANDIRDRYLKQPNPTKDLSDPSTNLEYGVAYLAHLRDVYGDWRQAPSWDSTVEQIAAAYNGGYSAANNIIKGNGLNDTQTVVYSRDAFNMWRERHASSSPTYNRWLERGGSTLIESAKKHGV